MVFFPQLGVFKTQSRWCIRLYLPAVGSLASPRQWDLLLDPKDMGPPKMVSGTHTVPISLGIRKWEWD